jgi:hypothetical protein
MQLLTNRNDVDDLGAIAPVPWVSALSVWFSSMTRLESAASGGGPLEG